MNEVKEEVFGRFSGIVISKESLLSSLETNKRKHDELYNLAIDNYKRAVEKYVENYTLFYKGAGHEYFDYAPTPSEYLEKWDNESEFTFPGLSLQAKPPAKPVKPSNYSDQYLSAIRRVELSIYDKFELTENEFQPYVLNNWSWKSTFTETVKGLAFYGGENFYTTPIATGYYAGSCISGAITNF